VRWTVPPSEDWDNARQSLSMRKAHSRSDLARSQPPIIRSPRFVLGEVVMEVEHFRIRIDEQITVVVDLAKESLQSCRFRTIQNALLEAGASEMTPHTFLIASKCVDSIQDFGSELAGHLGPGDRIVLLQQANGNMDCQVFLKDQPTSEGITVA